MIGLYFCVVGEYPSAGRSSRSEAINRFGRGEKKGAADFKRAESLDARVKELEISAADAEETKRRLEEAEEAEKKLEDVNQKLQDEYNILKDSFEILNREKTDAQTAEKTTIDRAVVAEAQLASLWAELERVTANPTDEARERIIDEYHNSTKFQAALADIGAP